MRAPATLAFAFALGVGAGIGAAWALVRLGARVALTGRPEAGEMLTLLAPLGGLAAFALVYGLGRGRAMRWLFWLLGPVVVYAAAGAGIALAGRGPVVAGGAAGLIVLGAALALLIRDARHG